MIREAVITNIVDGDTFDAEVSLGFDITVKQRFRLDGFNAPEVVGKTKEKGLQARRFVLETLLSKRVKIISKKQDTFRRWLADVYYLDEKGNEINLGNKLFQEGLAEYKNYE